jgi:CMP-N-acetylneuraminic acid synthetase
LGTELIYISSESENILKLAEELSINLLKRNLVMSNNEVTLDSIIYKSLSIIQAQNNPKYDGIMTLQSTSPILCSKTLNKVINTNA